MDLGFEPAASVAGWRVAQTSGSQEVCGWFDLEVKGRRVSEGRNFALCGFDVWEDLIMKAEARCEDDGVFQKCPKQV